MTDRRTCWLDHGCTTLTEGQTKMIAFVLSRFVDGCNIGTQWCRIISIGWILSQWVTMLRYCVWCSIYLPLAKSCASILTILHPIACEETRASVRFSCFVYNVRFFLLIARSSIVSGQEWFITLLKSNTKDFEVVLF